jgi:hypothetical protein
MYFLLPVKMVSAEGVGMDGNDAVENGKCGNEDGNEDRAEEREDEEDEGEEGR